jgi:hypothetical protein
MTASTTEMSTRHASPWVIAIIIGFITLVVVNGVFICIAVKGADPVVESYRTETR